jgi:AraC-like DNA-binding protein
VTTELDPSCQLVDSPYQQEQTVTGPFPDRITAPTVSASGTLALAHYLIKNHRMDPAAIEAALGHRLGDLENPDYRLPAQDHYRLWPFAIEQTGDQAVGLKVGEIIDPDRMGLMGHIFFNSDTLGRAIDQYIKLHRLVNEAVRIHRISEGDWVRLVWEVEAPEFYCQADVERTLSAAVARARHFIHPRLEIDQLTLCHQRPPWVDEYQRIFQCPLVFGASQVSLRFASGYLDWRLPHRNPYVYGALLGHVNRVLAHMSPRRQVSRKVRRLIARQLANGTVEADRIAEQLHMSRQTLYRKLKHEGHGFQELIEEVRRERALRYVAADRYALGEIAFLLGFSELSAFSRAFKRWTGESPARYRQSRRSAG